LPQTDREETQAWNMKMPMTPITTPFVPGQRRVILAVGLTLLPGVLLVALSLQHVLCTG
jgi:hypothetical protein